MLKLIFMIHRIEGMSYERFVEHHRDRHAPLFTSIPEAESHVRKYTVSHPVPAENYPPRAYDGLTEIWSSDGPTRQTDTGSALTAGPRVHVDVGARHLVDTPGPRRASVNDAPEPTIRDPNETA
ncbi:EthD domain-containing protein [Streptomyces sp. NPDC047017]|uniref:EthD domain-containing protein n=1 Tax=Streptomyces sp. NPDC047017 TaxID=3155024 RepID=UPI0033D512AD